MVAEVLVSKNELISAPASSKNPMHSVFLLRDHLKMKGAMRPTRAYIDLPKSLASCLHREHTQSATLVYSANFNQHPKLWKAKSRQTDLLILRLFFLDPNNPCMNKIGDFRFGSSETGLTGS